MEHCITTESVGAVMHFACECVEDVCEGLVQACCKHASWSLPQIDESALKGIGSVAAGHMLDSHAKNTFLGRTCDVMEGFKFVERWADANKSPEAEQQVVAAAGKLLKTLELNRLPHDFLSKRVRPSGLVEANQLFDALEHVIAASYAERDADKTRKLEHYATLEIPSDLADDESDDDDYDYRYGNSWDVAVGGTGQQERLAVIDGDKTCVHVFDMHTQTRLFTCGRRGKGQGKFVSLAAAAFNARGELYVSDWAHNIIQVFDTEGKFLRCIGSLGEALGHLSRPTGMALSSEGHMIVCDSGNDRVQIFREDGTQFVLGAKDGDDVHGLKFSSPHSAAVGTNGSILVMDNLGVHLWRDSVLMKIHDMNSQPVTPCIAVRPAGEIILAGNDLLQLYAYGPNGRTLWEVKQHEHEFSHLDGLCMNSCGCLFAVGINMDPQSVRYYPDRKIFVFKFA